MTKLDAFESVFKSASKPRFEAESIVLKKVLVVTDLDASEVDTFVYAAKGFLAGMPDLEYTVSGLEKSVEVLLGLVEAEKPDLIVTYRNLGTDAYKYPFSLGVRLDVFTQATTTPVLVLPHPKAGMAAAHAMKNTMQVMVVTDHLTGDDHLVSVALALTQKGGTLTLTHVEDQDRFDYFLDRIAKIPEIDTDTARERLQAQLLKEPSDYIDTVVEAIEAAHTDVRIRKVVKMGPELEVYRRLIDENDVDLLVLNSKDEKQRAMDALAYALAIEIRQIPMLLL